MTYQLLSRRGFKKYYANKNLLNFNTIIILRLILDTKKYLNVALINVQKQINIVCKNIYSI